jgi:GGDEF domain-containing protein
MIELHPELARSIVNELPAGIAVIDADGRVVWGNVVLSKLLKRDPGDIIGRSAESLQLPLPQHGSSERGEDPGGIVEKGSLIGVSRYLGTTTFRGCALLVIDRENAIDWFFDALSSGGFDGSAASRFLTRNAVLSRLQLEVSRSRRYSNPLSCLVIRIDFGTGDPNAQRRTIHDMIAATLTEQLRWVDVLGQWSDQALLVILPETTDIAALQLANKVADALHPDLAINAPRASINVGSSNWRKGDDAERLVRRADIVARRQIGSTARTISFKERLR